MTFHLDEFTVTITAKRDRYSEGRRKDLAVLLTRLACHEWDAKKLNQTKGYNALARENNEYAEMFHVISEKLRGGEA